MLSNNNPTQLTSAKEILVRPFSIHIIPASLQCNLEWCRKYILLLLSTFKAKEPTRHEAFAVNQSLQKMRTKYTDEHEHYLVELYVKSGLTTRQRQYVRQGDIWKELGFQNRNPASDIRGGGLLCLDNMLYFLQAHRHVAQSMIQNRAKGWETYETYPWAPASINLTRLVASEFGICGGGSGGQIKNERSPLPPKTSYHFLLETDGFSRIYVLAFFLLDKVWDEQHATYMQFNSVLEAVRRELSEAIILATSLSELEQQVFHRVNHVPSFRIPAADDSPLSSQLGHSDENMTAEALMDTTTKNTKGNFFSQKLPEEVFYASIEDLEKFLSASPKISQDSSRHHHSTPANDATRCEESFSPISKPPDFRSDAMIDNFALESPLSSSSQLRQRSRHYHQ